MAAAGGYLLESFTFFLAPASGHLASYAVVTTAGIAEVSLCLYLLFRGVRRGAGNPPSSEGPAFAGGRGVC